ncbi:MAG: DUF523 domain-containing protein [Erysipelotrichaceae bacterium]|nr:DUF523 domain-containing protein [Erysipelotrichaceae bacterium]
MLLIKLTRLLRLLMNIGISSCLLGECCTYNATHHLLEEIKLINDIHFIAVCPEVIGGLPIPRDPCEIISQDPLKIISIKGEDKTSAYVQGSLKALKLFKDNDVKIALLKYKSPSCGCDGIYDGSFSHRLINGQGVFASICSKNKIEVFHEKQLKEFFDYIEKNCI